MMKQHIRLLLTFCALFAIGHPGCSCNDGGGAQTDGSRMDAPGTGGSGADAGTPGTGGMNVICTIADEACTADGDCCSRACDPVARTCKSSVTTCSGAGSSCQLATDCCNLQCDTTTHLCANAASCVADNQACAGSNECCSQSCSGGHCQPLSATCLTAGNPCTASGAPAPSDGGSPTACCSGLCTNGKCVLGASFCIQPGDACSRDLDCCGGFCNKAQGATLGVCQDVQTTGTGSCIHDGVLCAGCGACCSRNCGPWALTGVDVCQPGLGCKILNSFCTRDSECCGGEPLADGGAPVVSCLQTTSPDGVSIGVCAQNHGLQQPGGICGGLSGNNACGNAQHDCDCPLNPKDQCCAYDTLGLPRCFGAGSCASADGGVGVYQGTNPNCCVAAGGSCHIAAECCNNVPCVPDATGALHCLAGTPTDAGIVCVPSGGTCTATGDCCTGQVCNVTAGAPSGTCGAAPSPADGGAACGLYGQACNGSVNCCNGVQCTYSADNTPCNGRAGCTCYDPVIVP